MRKILLLLPFFLWACGGGSKSPTEPSNVAIPAVQNLSIEIEEDTPIVIELPKTNNSASGLTYSISTDSQYGSVSIVNGNATYTPNENYFGTDSFVFSISNGETTSSLATVSITITSVNDAPVVEDIVLKNGNVPVATLIGSDVDGDQITFEIVDNPSYGDAYIDGNEINYIGNQEDSFSFKANDGELDSNIGIITVYLPSSSIEQRMISKRYPQDGRNRSSNGRQYGYALAEGIDGGIILAGLNGESNTDAYIVNLDNTSAQISSHTFDYPGGYEQTDYFNDVQATSDGGYILCGFSKYRLLLTKVDSNGNQEWYKTFGQDYNHNGQRVIELNDGNFLIAGTIHNGYIGGNNPQGDYSWELYVIKTDSSGNEIWSKKFNHGNNSPYPKGIIEDNDGSIVIGSNYDGNGLITKIDSNGNLLWEKVHTSYGEMEAFISSSFGGYVGTSVGVNGTYPYIFKLDYNGDEEWAYLRQGDNSILESIVEDDDGYIFSGLTFVNSSQDVDIYILKTDFNGDQIWALAYHDNESEIDYGSSDDIIKTSDGNFSVIGISWPDAGNSSEADIAYIKIDSEGNEID